MIPGLEMSNQNEEELNNNSTTNDENKNKIEERNEEENQMRVIAFFIGHKIDLQGISMEKALRSYKKSAGKDNIIFEINHNDNNKQNGEITSMMAQKGNNRYSTHTVVYRYGSIVFFNVQEVNECEKYLDVCKKYTSEPLVILNKEDYEEHILEIRSNMVSWYRQEGDRVILKELDLDNMQVISSVLGQSVALHNYSRQVDRALEEFNSINREMEKNGSFTVSRNTLFRIVARNNIMITEAIIMLGLLDKSETAWTNDKYYGVWSMMQNEYELSTRFEAVDKKITLLQDSAKYFLQILQDKKSNFLEILIIVLICGEVIVMLYDIFTR